MKLYFIPYLLCFLIMSSLYAGHTKKEKSSKIPSAKASLYHSIDPRSILQNLAFYELYPETEEGKKALAQAWSLLSGEEMSPLDAPTLPSFDIQSIISLVTKQPSDAPTRLSSNELELIEKLSKRLSHAKLKGATVWTKEEIAKLPPEEIDLSRSLLVYQFENETDAKEKIRQYEASITMMALQILAYLPNYATHEEKIREINRFIFEEMRFRFPPHSLHAKDIDLYTFLPSVLDSRQGVCLGVSILYLSLAQRLDLPLEIITPPGHIYLSYKGEEKTINIETTARGINIPTENYLGINTYSLQKRTIKEVVGLAFMNQASVTWGQQNYKETQKLYEIAQVFLPEDPLLKMLLGFTYVFNGKKREGEKLLAQVKGITFEGSVCPETMPEDYLQGKVDAEGIKSVFLPVDENRSSIIAKQEELQKILKRYPKFRAGLIQLATSYLQLGRGHEAKDILLRYHKIDPSSSTVEYYLSVLSIQRYDFNLAWHYLKQTESITARCNHYPKALKMVRGQLKRSCPDPD